MTISDDKLIAKSFNDYFINIGPKLAVESTDDPSDDDPITDERVGHYSVTRFKFSEIIVLLILYRFYRS